MTWKQASNYGLILTKLHEIIQYKQKEWLQSYIDLNTKLRTEAKTDFEKDCFWANEQGSHWKNYEECKKPQKY